MQRSRSEPHVVALVGSPRARGNTSLLVDAVLDELARRGARCDKIMLGTRRIAPCLGHEDCTDFTACPHDDDAVDVLDLVYAADCLVLATPVYYENVSAQMKAFIDRNVFRYAHDEWLPAKAVGLIAVTAETGLDETLAALRRYVALSTDGDVAIFSLGGYADKLGAAAADAVLMAAARQLGADLADALGLSLA
jgi:multimeric flavodoxin WrbA